MWYIIIILEENFFGNFYKCEFSLFSSLYIESIYPYIE